jgi:hypothetical protein
MRLKGQDARRDAQVARVGGGPAEDRAVAEMDTVEIANCQRQPSGGARQSVEMAMDLHVGQMREGRRRVKVSRW